MTALAGVSSRLSSAEVGCCWATAGRQARSRSRVFMGISLGRLVSFAPAGLVKFLAGAHPSLLQNLRYRLRAETTEDTKVHEGKPHPRTRRCTQHSRGNSRSKGRGRTQFRFWLGQTMAPRSLRHGSRHTANGSRSEGRRGGEEGRF